MGNLTFRAPAKINLFLEVLGKRSDGYHEIETILEEIDLADRITLKDISSSQIIIHSTNPHIPEDDTNLAVKAAVLLRRYISEEQRGVNIYIEKNIPVGAGLGGGSSDAAGVLKGLNKLWKLNLKKEALLTLAEQIGMDVPFFIEGGICLARGRGEKITPILPRPSLWLAVAVPPIEVSTRWVYGRLSISSLTKKIKINRILNAIRSSDTGKIGRQLFNRLEEVTLKEYMDIGRLKEAMLAAGASGAVMSGSGSAVFGIFSDARSAYKMRDAMKDKEEVYVVKAG